jgi:hypothetical protein
MPGQISLETLLSMPLGDVELMLRDDGGLAVLLPGSSPRQASLWWDEEGFQGEIWADNEKVAHATYAKAVDLIGFVAETRL